MEMPDRQQRRIPWKNKWLFAALAICAMSGCSHVPMATFAYLKSLPHGVLEQVNPADIRVAVNLPMDVRLTNLMVKLKAVAKGETYQSALPLVPVTAAVDTSAMPKVDSGNTVWNVYQLTGKGREGFQRFQRFLAAYPLNGKTRININVQPRFDLSADPCDSGREVPLMLAILLRPKDGYVVAWHGRVELKDLKGHGTFTCIAPAGTRAATRNHHGS